MSAFHIAIRTRNRPAPVAEEKRVAMRERFLPIYVEKSVSLRVKEARPLFTWSQFRTMCRHRPDSAHRGESILRLRHPTWAPSRESRCRHKVRSRSAIPASWSARPCLGTCGSIACQGRVSRPSRGFSCDSSGTQGRRGRRRHSRGRAAIASPPCPRLEPYTSLAVVRNSYSWPVRRSSPTSGSISGSVSTKTSGGGAGSRRGGTARRRLETGSVRASRPS